MHKLMMQKCLKLVCLISSSETKQCLDSSVNKLQLLQFLTSPTILMTNQNNEKKPTKRDPLNHKKKHFNSNKTITYLQKEPNTMKDQSDEHRLNKEQKKRQKKIEQQEDVEPQAQQEYNHDQQIEQDQIQEQLEPEIKNQNIQDNSTNKQKPSWYFSEYKFEQLDLCPLTLQGLKKSQFQQMTHIQSRTLPYLLKGRDVMGAAKTGSGKTLAFLIPCIQLLYKLQFTQKQGTGVIIITPTRQLALQIYGVARKIMEFHSKTVGVLIGGVDRKTEARKLEKGVNLLICTPGRLLDHLQNSKFIYHNLLSLVIDEADAILRVGFEEVMNEILSLLPKQRQTILFSATQTKKVDSLARLSLREPIYIGVDDVAQQATVSNLEQGFVIIPADFKFRLLFTFLLKNKGKKIMVFLSSCNSVKFYSDLLNYVDIPVLDIHGKQKQQKRSSTFEEFGKMKSGVLLCTDVAARGLDIPEIDWIIQFDPPDDTKQYIHRVGRTCRGYQSRGKALLILLEEQEKYLTYLTQARVTLNQFQFEKQKLVNIQEQLEELVSKNYFLKNSATDAFRSCLHSYATHSLKDVFNVEKLDLKKVALSFGLTTPPHVDLNLNFKKINRKIKKDGFNHKLVYK